MIYLKGFVVMCFNNTYLCQVYAVLHIEEKYE